MIEYRNPNICKRSSLDDLRGPECLVCGASLEGKRGDAIYCGRACAGKHYWQLEREARLEEKKRRPPCPECGKAVPLSLQRAAVYCSIECRKRYGNRILKRRKADVLNARRRQKRAEGRTGRPPCPECGGELSTARNGHSRFCSKRCCEAFHRPARKMPAAGFRCEAAE